MADLPKFNLRNPAVKRIMQEIKEIKQDTSGDFLAEALETDIFEWHFMIRGPQDTEFEGGIYHGRILLPAEYPFKPPSFMMLTPNGRFETNMKICLSISSHHPEQWQPSWSVRTALMALIAFMPSPGAGALGALDFPKEERRAMAARSRLEPPRFGSAERQRIVDEMHGRMLAMAHATGAERRQNDDTGMQNSGDETRVGGEEVEAVRNVDATDVAVVAAAAASDRQATDEVCTAAAVADVAEPKIASGDGMACADAAEVGPPVVSALLGSSGVGKGSSPDPPVASSGLQPLGSGTATSDLKHQQKSPSALNHLAAAHTPAAAGATAPAASPAIADSVHITQTVRVTPAVAVHAAAPNAVVAAAAVAAAVANNSTDHMLTALMWALSVGIGAILLRKVMGVIGFDISELLQL